MAKTPITILSGFLGAGKTTLLNRILNNNNSTDIAVFVNDFGSINIDAALVVDVKDDVVSLANGCVCCNLRDDLVQSIEEVIVERPNIKAVLLEASGVADPISIATTFNSPKLKNQFILENIVCLIDAEQFFDHWEHAALKHLKLLQIGCADMVLLNKVDMATPEEIQKVHNYINEQFNRVRIIETVQAQIPMDLLFDHTHTPKLDLNSAIKGLDDHRKVFGHWNFETTDKFNLEDLEYMVRTELPESVYRCKGIIQTSHDTQEHVIQIVGRRVNITQSVKLKDAQPKSKIVAIGNVVTMDRIKLDSLFNKCLVQS